MGFVIFLAIFLFALASIFWFCQAVDLMGRSDEEFPGKYDKPIWAGLFIFTFFFGALLFCVCKNTPGFFPQAKKPERLVVPEPRQPKTPAYPGESIACIECGTEIPASTSVCPKCGWTYETPKQ